MRLGWLALVIADLVVALIFSLVLRDTLRAAQSPSAYAAPHGADPAGRIYQNGNNNDNAGNGDNADNADNSQDNDNADNSGIDLGLPPPARSIRQPEPSCSTPGQDTVFTSVDRKVSMRIPGTSPRPVRVEFYLVINAAEAPPPPGIFVSPLVYEIKVSSCDADPLAPLPAEAALAIRYTDIEATGLDESRFVIGRLDMTTGSWVPLEQRAKDPAANVVAATIAEPGFYMVWEAR